jgi:hypothetical protein
MAYSDIDHRNLDRIFFFDWFLIGSIRLIKRHKREAYRRLTGLLCKSQGWNWGTSAHRLRGSLRGRAFARTCGDLRPSGNNEVCFVLIISAHSAPSGLVICGRLRAWINLFKFVF